ncbi:MAG: PP2C family protein-serine/threonine phosphatase [Bacteroidetes bacterium]|nr:PP2C family protein-serine/threonine phosphatase [Bacteroidota bacterium]MCW5896882.1 PP2C family protein-serine/threonine phosphatase [Bacteroidota bacterium]
MKFLSRFLLVAGPMFILLSLSFHFNDDGDLRILWRDNPAFALTFVAAGIVMIGGGWMLSRKLKPEEQRNPIKIFQSTKSEKAPYNIFGEMETAVRARMGIAVFLTFSIIGPITTLMSSSTAPIHPLTLLIGTLASGGIGSSFVFFGRRRILLVLVFLLFQAINMSAPQITRWVTQARPFPAIETSPEMTERLRDVDDQRNVVGALAVLLLVSGYVTWIFVLNKEGNKRVRYQTEIHLARDIQQQLLPSEILRTSSCEAFGITIPAADVGGDYFDFVRISDDAVAFVAADVSGHGIGAGILSTMTKSALRTQVLHDPAPIALLNMLNAVLCQISDKKTFVTLGYVLIERNAQHARIATAGHPPVILHSAQGGIQEFRTQSLGLGMQLQSRFTEISHPIEAGDMLVMYTDGVIEATNKAGEEFGTGRLGETVASVADRNAQEATEQIIGAVRAFTGREEFSDDATIVTVRII